MLLILRKQNTIYARKKENRKKLKKIFKKVLTKGAVRGIIVKRSRETAKNRKRKAERKAA